ncbi:YciI family protein [Pararhizobium sp. YC-54]|uniref:YciI family protein n=1 Tax=Pararhizobium sp. YC-54 TaxID=2986920 RepID=UPI0021F77F4C|nr:YciI family protein [Pararhizobium sp. YC-54]MCW0001833.1 YciI family protein [Pararhizobium sp. YC-54]
MQFTIIALDDTAEGTLDRRLAAREQHMERIHAMKADGSIIDGGALIDDDGKMIGSVVLCEFPDRAGLDAYIKNETYFREGVWKDINVLPFRRVQWRQ